MRPRCRAPNGIARSMILKRVRSPVPPLNVVMYLDRIVTRMAMSAVTGEKAYSSAGYTNASGKVTVESGKHPAIDRSVLEHERVHSRQVEEFTEAWQESDPGDTPTEGWINYLNTDVRNASAIEVEAYAASIEVVADWLAEHCPEFGVGD